MIVKEGSKYKVKSENGSKNLGTYTSKDQAVKRLQQVEYFKHKNKKKSSHKSIGHFLDTK